MGHLLNSGNTGASFLIWDSWIRQGFGQGCRPGPQRPRIRALYHLTSPMGRWNPACSETAAEKATSAFSSSLQWPSVHRFAAVHGGDFMALKQELVTLPHLDLTKDIVHIIAPDNTLAGATSPFGSLGPDQQQKVRAHHQRVRLAPMQLSCNYPAMLLSGFTLSSCCLEMLHQPQQPPASHLSSSHSSPIQRELRALCAPTIDPTIADAKSRL